MIPQDYAEWISLGLTVPTVILALGVIRFWGPVSLHIVSHRRVKKDDAGNWLILGVTLGFVGNIADNVYWGIAWHESFIGQEFSETLMFIGPFFNIFFRQIAGIAAAYCHLRSFACHSDRVTDRSLVLWVLTSIACGGAYMTYLLIIKGA